MLVDPLARFHQIAYVTRDLDAATAMFRECYGIERFFVLPEMPPGGPRLRIALASLRGVEIEVIEPIADAAIYADPLEGVDRPVLLHHVASRIEGTLAQWDAYRAGLDETVRPVVFEGGVGDDLRYAYTDERARLGHYLEHLWMSPTLAAQMDAAIPRFP